MHVGFLGMDGIGKTSMARLLAAELESAGVAVRSVSWREWLGEEGTRPNVRAALRELWVESWRLMFLGDADGPAIPTTYEQFEDEGWEDRLVGLDLSSNAAVGPFAAVGLELTGQVLLYHEVIRPLRERGVWVIEESYPLKLALKELLSARALTEDPRVRAEIDSTVSLLPELFRPRSPDLGIVVSGPVEMAYRWRMAEAGRTNSMEDLGAAGRKGREGFEALQGECDRIFREVAAEGDWLVFEMEDAPPEANFARLLEAVRGRLSLPAAAP